MRSQIGLTWFALTLYGGAWGQLYTSPQKPSAAVPLNPAASTLPAITPTDLSKGKQGAGSTPAQRNARRAEISFAAGHLTVKADNSSLNMILREIGRQTGIKITGGVTEERVFGSYGPDVPDVVLARLLDGTSSNVLMIASDGSAPGELILTPRLGGPTPPNPNAKGFDDDSGDDDAPRTPAPRGVTLFGAQPTVPQAETPSQQPQQANPFPPITTPSTPASPDGATATPANTQSPNGVKTPQEIYQQLQQLRQQQQQQQQTDTPPDGAA